MNQTQAVVWITFSQRVESEVQLSQSWQLEEYFDLLDGGYAVIVQVQPLQHLQVLYPLRKYKIKL